MQEPVFVLAAMEALNNEARLVDMMCGLLNEMADKGMFTPTCRAAIDLVGEIKMDRFDVDPSIVVDVPAECRYGDEAASMSVADVVGIEVTPVRFNPFICGEAFPLQEIRLVRAGGDVVRIVVRRVIRDRADWDNLDMADDEDDCCIPF